MIDIDIPDLGDHPSAPSVSLATFERWVIEAFIPQAIERGELTQESAITSFEQNEGRMEEFRYDGLNGASIPFCSAAPAPSLAHHPC